MSTIFSQEEVNTGRQREFDYLKGIFMLFIYLIHAFQATLTPEDAVAGWIFMFATMSGAAIFIFVMGVGTVYSRNATPKEFVKSGIRMVVYQYLNNLAYVASMLVPYAFVSGKLTETGKETLRFLIKMYIQYTNIFFITGIIYFVLALLKRLHLNIRWYVVLGVAFGLAAPLLNGIPVEIPVVGYLVKLLIGEADFVSFTPLYFVAYALFGVAFGTLLRHVRDKARFYKIFTIPCTAIVIVWWVLVFIKYGADFSELYNFLTDAYIHPSFWHVVASLAHIFVFAAAFYWIGGLQEPKNPAAKQLLYYSRHISKYYALHIIVYFAALGFHGYESFQSYQCWLLALLSMAVTELMVRGFNAYSAYRVSKRKAES